MKKVYCINCKFCPYYHCRKIESARDTCYKKNEDVNYYKSKEQNKDNNCEFYKRKWWKFFR